MSHPAADQSANADQESRGQPSDRPGDARPVVLAVDDTPTNLEYLTDLLSSRYRMLVANSGESGLRVARGVIRPDVILLDVRMPGMDGYTVLQKLREDAATRDIPVIFLTALSDTESEERGLRLGAADFVAKPIRAPILLARVRAQLEAKQARDWLANQNAALEEEVARRMAENNLIQKASIRALAHLAETRDPETGNHILRTQGYVQRLAESLRTHPKFAVDLEGAAVEQLARSAPLHDIGKVGIPDHVLLKPGPLSDEEWVVMRTHARMGSEAIELAERDLDASVEFLQQAKEIARSHHERWDGKGYPDGLAGDAIPLSARLMALADVFDALISNRPYKKAWPYAEARRVILEGRGTHFDPDVVDAFESCYEDFCAIADRYADVAHGTETPA